MCVFWNDNDDQIVYLEVTEKLSRYVWRYPDQLLLRDHETMCESPITSSSKLTNHKITIFLCLSEQDIKETTHQTYQQQEIFTTSGLYYSLQKMHF